MTISSEGAERQIAGVMPAAEYAARLVAAYGGLGHMRPIVGAMHTGLVVAALPPGGRYRGIPDALLGRPLLILIHDDVTGSQSRGPGAFDSKTLRRALDGASFILLHAAAARCWHYSMAAGAATAGGKAVIIECRPATETQWLGTVMDRAPDARTLVITPDAARYHSEGGRA